MAISIQYPEAGSPEELAAVNGIEIGPDAQRFFVTFGQRYARMEHENGVPAHPNGFWEILARDEMEAREYLRDNIDNHYSFIYPEDEWETVDASGWPWFPMGRILSLVLPGAQR